MPIILQLTSNFNKQLLKGKYFRFNMLRSGQVMSDIANIVYYRKILSIGTAGDEQTVQTQIRLLSGSTLFAIPAASWSHF